MRRRSSRSKRVAKDTEWWKAQERAIAFEKTFSVLENPAAWVCEECDTTDDVWLCLGDGRVLQRDRALAHARGLDTELVLKLNFGGEDGHVVESCDGDRFPMDLLEHGPLNRVLKRLEEVQSLKIASSRGWERVRSMQRLFSLPFFSAGALRARREASVKETALLRMMNLEKWRAFVQLKRVLSPAATGRASRLVTDMRAASDSVEAFAKYGSAKGTRPALFPGKTGLTNLGNTCYMNSTLQALGSLPPLRHLLFYWRAPRPSTLQGFLDAQSSAQLAGKAVAEAGAEAFGAEIARAPSFTAGEEDTELSEICPTSLAVHNVWEKQWFPELLASFAPDQAVHTIWSEIPQFAGFIQHDAEEFTRALIDKMDEELRQPTAVPSHLPSVQSFGGGGQSFGGGGQSFGSGGQSFGSGQSSGGGGAIAPKDGSSKKHTSSSSGIPPNDISPSPITALLGGAITTTRRCECGHSNESCEHTLGPIPLELPLAAHTAPKTSSRRRGGGITCDINELLRDAYDSKELLEGYVCDECHKPSTTTKLATLNPPAIMILHIVRTSWHIGGKKLNTPVTFPLEGLVVGGKEYDLFAMVQHQGATMREGHYTAFVRNPEWDLWMHCNDKRVTVIPPDKVKEAQPTLLFYLQSDLASHRAAAHEAEKAWRIHLKRPGTKRPRENDQDENFAKKPKI